jgi:putative spermidine/putrescine transport system ATP-binding protein
VISGRIGGEFEEGERISLRVLPARTFVYEAQAA